MTPVTSASRAWRLRGRDRGYLSASGAWVRRRIPLLALRATPNSILVAPVCTGESPSIRQRLNLRPAPLPCPERTRSGSRTHTRRYCTRRDSGRWEETRKRCVDAAVAGIFEGPCCFIPGCRCSGQMHVRVTKPLSHPQQRPRRQTQSGPVLPRAGRARLPGKKRAEPPEWWMPRGPLHWEGETRPCRPRG